jgi:hypothetical protein
MLATFTHHAIVGDLCISDFSKGPSHVYLKAASTARSTVQKYFSNTIGTQETVCPAAGGSAY